MRSQIPRPDQRIGKVVKISGQDVIICDEVWYRFLTAEHGDLVSVDVEAMLALSGQRTNTSKIENAAEDAETLSLIAQRGPNFSTINNRLNTLEALVLSMRSPITPTSGEDIDDTSWVPLVDGSEPPNFMTDGSGVLIFVAYTP